MAPAPPTGAELKRTESYQYPAGHVSHLTDPQTKALARFKELCQQKGYWIPETADKPASHDDETLLRYLRARKFIPADAFKQFKDTEDWREENHIDKLYEVIDVEEYEQSRKLYPQWLGTRDKRGIPVYLFEIGHLNNKAIAAYESNANSKLASFSTKVPVKMLRLFALYENLTRFALPFCSALPGREHPETPISQSSNIVDISDVSLMQFWKLKNHMQDASLLATAHYPETLDRIFLIGAPSFFPTVWGWVKRWFDPITVSKIFILGQKDTLPTLLRFMDIDKIPKKYGGNLDYKFGDLPQLEHDIAKHVTWASPELEKSRTISPGPIRWQYGANGDLEAVAVGTQNGVQRNQLIFSLKNDKTVAHMAIHAGRVAKAAQGRPTTTPSATNASTTQPSVTDTSVQPSTVQPDSTQPTSTQQSSTQQSSTQSSSTQSSNIQPSSITGTTSIPFRDSTTQAADKTSTVREGTSTTRYEQQSHTLAHGNVGDGTPAIARDGQGEKQAIMEPSTVGQAPKEHPLPDLTQPPTLVEQAQHTAEAALASATHAGHTVLAAVGLASKEEPAPVEKKHDPAIENMEGRNVEEYLRSKTASTA